MLLRACVALLPLSLGCVVGKRPVAVPSERGEAAVAVLSGAMPEPITDVARHAWIAARRRGQSDWVRYELWGEVHKEVDDPVRAFSGGSDVRLHGLVVGPHMEDAIDCLDRELAPYHDAHGYIPWPGPNSNTYVDVMLRRCGIHVDLPATCIGRDHRGIVGVSTTSGGTGVQLETPLVGLRIGATEGIEVHLFGLALGVDLWPPAIIVPLGAGRIGFDDR